MSTTTEKKYKLISSDNETFEVEESVAMMSNTIKNLIEDDCADDIGIPVSNVTGSTLAKIIEYCNKHAAGSSKTGENLLDWDKEFMKVDLDTLYDLVMGANYLDMKSLLDLACQTVADLIKGKTTEEIRKTFGIKNDFTPKEEEEIRQENAWAFE